MIWVMSTKKAPRHRNKCGTISGYRQHANHGEEQCEECREAYNAYCRERRAKVKSGEVTPRRQKRRTEIEEVADVVEGYPPFLGPSGRELWDALNEAYEVSPVSEPLVVEICRMKDRLDRCAAALANNNTLWLELGEPEELSDGSVQMQVVVNNLIGEARQLALSQAQLMKKLEVLQQAEKKSSGVSMTDQLQQRREARLAAAKAGEGA